MSEDDFYSDNLKPKFKRKRKRGASARLWLVAALVFGIAAVGAALYRAVPQPAASTVEFEVQPYPTFSAYPYRTGDMVATGTGFRVVSGSYDGMKAQDYTVDVANGTVKPDTNVEMITTTSVASVAISSIYDIVYSDYSGTTFFYAPDGTRQTIGLNAPTRSAFSGDGHRFAIMNPLGRIAVFDTRTRSLRYEITPPETMYEPRIRLNHDGTQLLTGSIYGQPLLYDLTGAAPRLIPTPPDGQTVSANAIFTPGNALVEARDALLLKDDSFRALPIIAEACRSAENMEISPDGRLLATTALSYVCVYDLSAAFRLPHDTPVKPLVIDLKAEPWAVAFTADSQYLGVYSHNYTSPGMLVVINPAKGQIVATTER